MDTPVLVRPRPRSLGISRKCDECWTVRRCRAYPVDVDGAPRTLAYLCRPCARKLGYREESPRKETR